MIAIVSAVVFTLLAFGVTGFVAYRRARRMVDDVQAIAAELEPQVSTLTANAERANEQVARLSQGRSAAVDQESAANG